MIPLLSLQVSCSESPLAPPESFQRFANPFGLDLCQLAVRSQVSSHLHDQAGVPLSCHFDLFGKIMLDMGAHEEKIRHQQNPFGTPGDAGINTGLDIWFMHL